jgi:ring-1,2-phenylacetyl-CoA epoxidase subunit PaaC
MHDDFENPYDLLGVETDGADRWAFGTGFVDPLAGIDTCVPAGVDATALSRYCLALGDDALVYSHRLQQWMTRMPELEEETAIANVALDLLGQGRMLLSRAGGILGRTEDELAFLRSESEFRNVRLVERLDTDFAELTGRLLIFSTWRLGLFEALAAAPDPVLAAIAAKGAKELTYHRGYAARWVVRLGDGTEESHRRMQRALEALWPLVDELFRTDPDAPVGVSRASFDATLEVVCASGGLTRPEVGGLAGVGGRFGRDGVHTEAMGYVLTELQSVAREYPDATW